MMRLHGWQQQQPPHPMKDDHRPGRLVASLVADRRAACHVTRNYGVPGN